MLFGYPIAATQNNWLHQCLCEALQSVHALVEAGAPFPPWPTILPQQYRQPLRLKTGLRDRIASYYVALTMISAGDRALTLGALESENRIADLLAGVCECTTIDQLPTEIQDAAKSLFEFAFDLLAVVADGISTAGDEKSIRDRQYERICAITPDNACPFCGLFTLAEPGEPREPLDHYLAKSRYPFAAANLRNLVPMCNTCNSRYKLAVDVLRRIDGSRRIATDPYDHARIAVLLDESEVAVEGSQIAPRWKVSFVPDTPAASTWDEVFSIRERYHYALNKKSVRGVLKCLADYARRMAVPVTPRQGLLDALRNLEELYSGQGYRNRAFLDAATYRMLRLQCESGNEGLVELLCQMLYPTYAGSSSSAAGAAGASVASGSGVA